MVTLNANKKAFIIKIKNKTFAKHHSGSLKEVQMRNDLIRFCEDFQAA